MKTNKKMIIRKYHMIMASVVLASAMVSCSDLIEEPKNIVTESNFYTNKGEAEAGLTGAMAQAAAAANVGLGEDDIKYN